MKKFLVFLIIAGGIGAAAYFYDPYIKPYLAPPSEPKKSPAPAEVARPSDGAPATPSAPAKNAPAAPAPEPAPPPPAVPAKSDIDRIVEERYPIPQLVPLAQIVNQWNNVPARAFPEQVALLEGLPIVLRDPAGNKIGESVSPPGTLMKPVSLNGPVLTVASLANPSIRNEISIDKTDFKARVQKRYDDFIAQMNSRILAQREKAKQALLAKPEALAALAGGPAISLGPNDDPRIAPVKASLAQGKVTAFTLEEAVGFRWNGSERINGEKFRGVYDTVTVKYEAKTIFGAFPGEAKCLLQAGRVIGWIDPITEDELI